MLERELTGIERKIAKQEAIVQKRRQALDFEAQKLLELQEAKNTAIGDYFKLQMRVADVSLDEFQWFLGILQQRRRTTAAEVQVSADEEQGQLQEQPKEQPQEQGQPEEQSNEQPEEQSQPQEQEQECPQEQSQQPPKKSAYAESEETAYAESK